MDATTVTLIVTQVTTVTLLILKEILAYYYPSANGVINGILSSLLPTTPTVATIEPVINIVNVVPNKNND